LNVHDSACIVLFDLEGTLVQSIEDNKDAVLEFRTKTADKLVALGIPREAVRFHREMDRFLKGFELRWALQSKIFPETRSVLHTLKRLGVQMGIVTNTSRDAVDQMLSMHKLAYFFKVIVTREDVRRLKPDPEGIMLALRKLDGHSFFFIGDLVHDSLAAKKAGGVSIIVRRNPLKTLGFEADHIVSSLEEVPDIVRSSCK